MPTNKTIPAEPFWMDEPNPYSDPYSKFQDTPFWKIIKFSMICLNISTYILVFGIIYLLIKYPFSLIIIIILSMLLFGTYLFPRFKETHQSKALRIQQLAKDETGAELLGSAIHTAGHPLLKTDQPVVFGLKNSELSIYGFDSSTPIDSLPLIEIEAVDLVVFDDNNVPHIGVIHNAAQSLQVTFQRNNSQYKCSFRRFYKVRAVDWYHAIQTTS